MAAPARKDLVSVLWLMPAAPARDFFCATIDRLAQLHQAPTFEPHVTLGLTEENPALPQQIVVQPIRLGTIGIFFSSMFTKTLFVRFEITSPLQDLRASLGLSGTGYDPHLSLLYCELPATRKAQLACSLVLPFSSVLFDGIGAVRRPNPTLNRTDVEAWEFLGSRKLRALPGKGPPVAP